MLLVSAVSLRSILSAAEELHNVSVRRFHVEEEPIAFEGGNYLWINPGEDSPGQILSLLKNTAAETSANGWGDYVLSSNDASGYQLGGAAWLTASPEVVDHELRDRMLWRLKSENGKWSLYRQEVTGQLTLKAQIDAEGDRTELKFCHDPIILGAGKLLFLFSKQGKGSDYWSAYLVIHATNDDVGKIHWLGRTARFSDGVSLGDGHHFLAKRGLRVSDSDKDNTLDEQPTAEASDTDEGIPTRNERGIFLFDADSANPTMEQRRLLSEASVREWNGLFLSDSRQLLIYADPAPNSPARLGVLYIDNQSGTPKDRVLLGELRIQNIVDADDQRHVWLLPSGTNGVYLLDTKTPEIAPREFVANERIQELVKAERGKVWALPAAGKNRKQKGVWLLSASDPTSTGKLLFQDHKVQSVSRAYPNLGDVFSVTTESGEIVVDQAGKPVLAATNANLMSQFDYMRGSPDAHVIWVEPSGGHWEKPIPRTIKSDQTAALHLQQDLLNSSSGADSRRWLPALDEEGRYLWVAEYEGSGLFAISYSGDIIPKREAIEQPKARFLSDVSVGDVTPTAESGKIWAPGAQNSGGAVLALLDLSMRGHEEQERILLREPVEDLHLTSNPNRIWLTGTGLDNRKFLLTVQAEPSVPPFRITAGSRVLATDATAADHVTEVDLSEDIAIEMQCPIVQDAVNANGTVNLTVANGKDTASGSVTFSSSKPWGSHFRLAPSSGSVIPRYGKSKLELSYHDDWGSDLRLVVPEVSIDLPYHWWQKPSGAAVLAWLATCVIVGISQAPLFRGLVSRYLPLIISVVASGGSFIAVTSKSLDIDLPLFFALTSGTLVTVTAAGILNSRWLRILARVTPFDIIVPKALIWPPLRRRYFVEYVQRVAREIARVREQANDERYVAIPAQISEPAEQRGILTRPDEDLFERLVSRTSGMNVLIESPGGRGKSALLRRIVELAIERFRKTGTTPIPIVCTNAGKLVESAYENIGRYALSEVAFREQLESGFFFFVIDGVSEIPGSPNELEAFLKSSVADTTRTLLSTRPDPAFHQAFLSDQPSVIAEPQRLDDTTILTFEEKYLGVGNRLSERARRVCRGRDGTYLPILVRLAIRAGSDDLQSVADVYETTFDALVKSPGQRSVAAALCMQTYWKTGARTLAVSTPGHQTTIADLLTAGVLVPFGKQRNRVTGIAEEVKFFHDSMQSYLTAEGLFALPDRQGWSRLIDAAGASRFISAQSDLLTDGGSELFEMCLEVFRPREELRDVLTADLSTWAEENHSVMTAEQIIAGVPPPLRQFLPQKYTITQLLEQAIEQCCSHDREADDIQDLARLYAHLAPTVWPKRSV